MSNLTGMSLLKCTEWKVFLLQALKGDGVGGVGAKEEVASVKRPQKEARKGKKKRSQLKKRKVLSFSSVSEFPSCCSGSALFIECVAAKVLL